MNHEDLNSYYHIYEISTEDFAGAVNFANELSTDAQESLKQLRFLFSLHAVARKLILIDFLALRPRPAWSDFYLWRRVERILQTLSDDCVQARQSLELALDDSDESVEPGSEIKQDGQPTSSTYSLPGGPSQVHMRRFEALAAGIRTLNAKVRIVRDDLSDLIANDASESSINATIGMNYEHIGQELRQLLVDWERNRGLMLLSVDVDSRPSRPSSGARSPISPSPSPSLGGVTMVDGGPADALRVLNGDLDGGLDSQGETLDEEIFEAVAKPRKRMSLALSREEKMARLQEDRRKRATLQEHAETTTNMLRELQMVIKHRPQSRPHPRVTSV